MAFIRILSPKSAPPVLRFEGSTETIAMVFEGKSIKYLLTNSSTVDDFPEPPVPVIPKTGIVDFFACSLISVKNSMCFFEKFSAAEIDFANFNESLKEEINQVQNSNGLRVNDDDSRIDVIHYSSIPWHTFSGLTHARNYKRKDSAPKITFGKMFQKGDQKMMNVAIYVHHGLADGFHIAKYLNYFQKFMNGE